MSAELEQRVREAETLAVKRLEELARAKSERDNFREQQAKLRKAAQAVMDSVVPGTRSGRPTVSHDALGALASALAATTEDRSKK